MGASKTPLALALIAAALFGAATPASKLLLSSLTPFQLAGILYLGAALGVAPFAWRGGAAPWRADRRTRWRLAGAVISGGILGPIFLLQGLRMAGASSVSLWLNLELVATSLLGILFFRDHLDRRGWLGVTAALAGASALSWGPGTGGWLAAGLVGLACLCWGLDNQLTALIDGMTPSQSTFWKGLVAGTVNLGIGIAMDPLSAAPRALAIATVVGVLSYGASIVLYIEAAQRLGASRAQIIFATAPVFGVGLSMILLEESLGASHFAAAGLFALAIGLLLRERHGHDHVHDSLVHEHAHRHDDGHHDHAHPGLAARATHTHRHEHRGVRHDHPHQPDLHHRHDHRRSAVHEEPDDNHGPI